MVTVTVTTTTTTTDAVVSDPHALLRLFHLVSPALPVGAYAYSQGLEYAVHAGWIRDEAGTLAWLEGLSSRAVGTLDLPILYRLQRAWQAGDLSAVDRWNAQLLASRETAELRAEDLHLGGALARVLIQLEVPGGGPNAPRPSRPCSRSRRRNGASMRPIRCAAISGPGATTRFSPPSNWCRWARAPASACCTD
jgi:hypothetical protein